MKIMTKTILFAALLGIMLVGCDGDIDEISMELELSTAVSGGSIDKKTKFDSGNNDTIFMLGELYADNVPNDASHNKLTNGFEVICTTSGGDIVTFMVKCTNIARPVVEDQYNDVLREELRRWIQQQYAQQGGSWIDKTENWTVRREVL